MPLPLVKEVYIAVFASLKKKPAILIPFLVFAALEVLALGIVGFAPSAPFRQILGPPIIAFFGEKYLQYPLNLLLLPNITYQNRIMLALIAGPLLTGAAAAMVFDLYSRKAIRLTGALGKALRKYVHLFTVVMLLALTLYYAAKIVNPVWLKFTISILIQAAFIYTIPFIVIGNEKIINSLIKSFALFRRLFIPTIIIVGLPMMLYIPIIGLKANAVFSGGGFFPASALLVSVLAILTASLGIDPLLTIGSTYLFLYGGKQARGNFKHNALQYAIKKEELI